MCLCEAIDEYNMLSNSEGMGLKLMGISRVDPCTERYSIKEYYRTCIDYV